jgi:hypothetical protein
MTTYKLQLSMIDAVNIVYGDPNAVVCSNGTWIPFDPSNTDYQNFKAQINADEAQLEDADGNLMTAEQAKEFVATLP